MKKNKDILAKPKELVRTLIRKLADRYAVKPQPNVSSQTSRENGYVTFNPGGFVFSPTGRPDFSGKIYYETRAIRDLLTEYLPASTVPRSLEIGCGYGRLSPWIAEFAEDSWAIDPNEEAIAEASRNHPSITFEQMGVQDMTYEDDTFDLLVSWTALQHVPEAHITDACAEIRRVMRTGATVILAEHTQPSDSDTRWGRSESRYEELLQMELLASQPKPVERTFEQSEDPSSEPEKIVTGHPNDVLMVFRN
ncbi:class I SAM-dependent methyltransferase [Salinibacter ruber]|uniref:class I SAM-dependent methyltransferase n=1 Tax=Salinibacter ruber TaxID=146919 RepID=UPI002168B84B|nr:class I SAM-dependent methyltransferase [Salinibacter ruber]MCS4142547.1 SAM-dependent methyltransferase [Salinibacter ruber]